MTPTVTLITPTADQPTGIALCERFMAAQTFRDFHWIVIDDGLTPAALTMGQQHVRREREGECMPAESFCRNLLTALPLVQTDLVAMIEHDDYYAPGHLLQLVERLSLPNIELAGDDLQRYYNVAQRRWKTFDNWGAAMCQTGLRRSVFPQFELAIQNCLQSKWRGVDRRFWQLVPRERWSLNRAGTVVGIKGLPGRAGIGIGHRPDEKWNIDEDGAQLREWVGPEMSEVYRSYATP